MYAVDGNLNITNFMVIHKKNDDNTYNFNDFNTFNNTDEDF